MNDKRLLFGTYPASITITMTKRRKLFKNVNTKWTQNRSFLVTEHFKGLNKTFINYCKKLKIIFFYKNNKNVLLNKYVHISRLQLSENHIC